MPSVVEKSLLPGGVPSQAHGLGRLVTHLLASIVSDNCFNSWNGTWQDSSEQMGQVTHLLASIVSDNCFNEVIWC